MKEDLTNASKVVFDFLLTYGWAILTLLLITAVLAYVGIFTIPHFPFMEYCSLEAPLVCQDFSLSATKGLFLLLKNSYSYPITLKQEHLLFTLDSGRKINWGNCRFDGQNKQEVVVKPGRYVQITCAEQLDLEPGSRAKIRANVKYIKQSYPRPVQGVIIAKVVP